MSIVRLNKLRSEEYSYFLQLTYIIDVIMLLERMLISTRFYAAV